jgi:hypothetical protein
MREQHKKRLAKTRGGTLFYSPGGVRAYLHTERSTTVVAVRIFSPKAN